MPDDASNNKFGTSTRSLAEHIPIDLEYQVDLGQSKK
jgi:hypothetical protein